MISRIKEAAAEAGLAGWRAWARQNALHGTEGFSEAWSIAQNVPGWLSDVNAATFWGVLAHRRTTRVVEIGSYLGRSTVLLALALRRYGEPGASVVAIDPHTGDRQHLEALGLDSLPSLDLFRLHLRGAGVHDMVDTRVELSDHAAESWQSPIDVLYVDGWHSYDAVRMDTLNFGRWLTDDGVVCFDDYSQYPEVKAAVDDACAELGLHFYGPTTLQAWAGRAAKAPAAVESVIKLSRPIHAIRAANIRRGARTT